jgi:hypothetical protein
MSEQHNGAASVCNAAVVNKLAGTRRMRLAA